MALDQKQVKSAAAYFSTLTDESDRLRFIAQMKMLAVNEAPQEAFAPPIRTLGQYLSDPIEIPPTLVEPHMVVRGGMSCTIGRAGKGKTVMNLNRHMRWCAGLPWFDGWEDGDGNPMFAPERPLKSLIIENEGAGGLFHRQVGIMLHAKGYLTEEQRDLVRENMLIWGDGGYAGLKLDDPSRLDGVRRGCEKWKPDIVFVEPFRGLWNGEENSATDMAVVIDALNDLAADYNCGVMLAHHERKSGVGEDGEKMSAGRGSTVLEGAVTVMENFESVKGGDYRELTVSKSRHGKAPNPVRMEWDPEAWWYKWVPSSNIEEAVLEALRGNADEPMNLAALSEFTNESTTKLRKITETLSDQGRVKKLASQPHPSGRGTTGVRYAVPTDPATGFGGLSV